MTDPDWYRRKMNYWCSSAPHRQGVSHGLIRLMRRYLASINRVPLFSPVRINDAPEEA